MEWNVNIKLDSNIKLQKNRRKLPSQLEKNLFYFLFLAMEINSFKSHIFSLGF